MNIQPKRFAFLRRAFKWMGIIIGILILLGLLNSIFNRDSDQMIANAVRATLEAGGQTVEVTREVEITTEVIKEVPVTVVVAEEIVTNEIHILPTDIISVTGVQDSFGIPFEIIGDSQGIEFVEWNTVNLNGDMGHAVLGKLRNVDPSRTIRQMKLHINYYDKDGQLLNKKDSNILVVSTRKTVPGVELDFRLWGGVNLQPDDFAQYTVEPRIEWE